MIRGILAILFVVIFLIVSIPIWGILWIVGRFNAKNAELAGLRIVQGAFRIVSFIAGNRVIVNGRENLPSKDEAVVYIANHRSFFDVICGYPLMPGLTGFIAKDSFEHVPLLSTWMRKLHCLFLNRTNTRAGMQMMLTAVDYVKSGVSIFIFPEGTRSKSKEMLEFKGGSFKIATKSKSKIIPVAFTNSSYVFEDRFPKLPWLRRGTIVITFGTPIETAGLTRQEEKELPRQVQKTVQEMLFENAKIWEQNATAGELKKARSLSNPGTEGKEPIKED